MSVRRSEETEPTGTPTPDLRLVVVDPDPERHLHAVVQRAVAERHAIQGSEGPEQTHGAQPHVAVPTTTVRLVASADDVDSETVDVVLVLVHEDVCQLGSDGKERCPCAVVAGAYRLLDRSEATGPDVYVAATQRLTGLDVLSMLLSGVGGVGQADQLAALAERALARRRWTMRRRQGDRLVVGDVRERLDALVQRVRYQWGLELPEWEVLLALAQVPKDQLRGPGKITTQTAAAAALRPWAEEVGLHVADGAYRHVKRVARCLQRGDEDDEEDDGENTRLTSDEKTSLAFLPLLARQTADMPRRPLPIWGKRPSEQSELLYRAIKEINVRANGVAQLPDAVNLRVRARNGAKSSSNNGRKP